MTTKKAQASSGARRSGGSAAGAKARPAGNTRAAATSVKTQGAEQAQARISQMLSEVQEKNDELTERVGRLLARLS